MAWLSSVTGDNTIVVQTTAYTQRYYYAISGYMIKRMVTRTETHYVGLTSEAADTQKTTSLEVSGVQSVQKLRDGDAGAYRVVEEKETYGDWEYEETVEEIAPP